MFKFTARHELCQHTGVLSGAASVAFEEVAAGLGSLKILRSNPQNFDSEGNLTIFPFGVQISANHVHMAREGEILTIHAVCVSSGKTLHVWNIDVKDSQGNLARVVNILKPCKK